MWRLFLELDAEIDLSKPARLRAARDRLDGSAEAGRLAEFLPRPAAKKFALADRVWAVGLSGLRSVAARRHGVATRPSDADDDAADGLADWLLSKCIPEARRLPSGRMAVERDYPWHAMRFVHAFPSDWERFGVTTLMLDHAAAAAVSVIESGPLERALRANGFGESEVLAFQRANFRSRIVAAVEPYREWWIRVLAAMAASEPARCEACRAELADTPRGRQSRRRFCRRCEVAGYYAAEEGRPRTPQGTLAREQATPPRGREPVTGGRRGGRPIRPLAGALPSIWPQPICGLDGGPPLAEGPPAAAQTLPFTSATRPTRRDSASAEPRSGLASGTAAHLL